MVWSQPNDHKCIRYANPKNIDIKDFDFNKIEVVYSRTNTVEANNEIIWLRIQLQYIKVIC